MTTGQRFQRQLRFRTSKGENFSKGWRTLFAVVIRFKSTGKGGGAKSCGEKCRSVDEMELNSVEFRTPCTRELRGTRRNIVGNHLGRYFSRKGKL